MKTVCLQSLKYIWAESFYKLDTDGNIFGLFDTFIDRAKNYNGKQDQESDMSQIIGHGSGADRNILIKITKINMYQWRGKALRKEVKHKRVTEKVTLPQECGIPEIQAQRFLLFMCKQCGWQQCQM